MNNLFGTSTSDFVPFILDVHARSRFRPKHMTRFDLTPPISIERFEGAVCNPNRVLPTFPYAFQKLLHSYQRVTPG